MANLFPGLTSEVFLGYDLISMWLVNENPNLDYVFFEISSFGMCKRAGAATLPRKGELKKINALLFCRLKTSTAAVEHVR